MENRQAVAVEPCKPLQIQDNPIPEAPAAGLVLKTLYCGICHTDINLMENSVVLHETTCMQFTQFPGFDFPIILGHEIAGEVYSLGMDQPSDSPNLNVGDKVLVYPWVGCGRCGACQTDKCQLCPRSVHSHIGFGTNGGYSTYVSIPNSRFVIKSPESLPLDVGAVLSCSGLSAYNALIYVKPFLQSATQIRGHATLLIVGVGGLALWTLALAKSVLKNTKVQIVAVSRKEEKLEMARAAGADVTVLWDPAGPEGEIISKTKEACGGGFDASIDFVSSSNTASRLFACANAGATNVLIGLVGGSLNIPLALVMLKSLDYHGIYTGSFCQFKELVELVAQGKVKPPLITHVTLEEAYNVLQKLKTGEFNGRGVIKY